MVEKDGYGDEVDSEDDVDNGWKRKADISSSSWTHGIQAEE